MYTVYRNKFPRPAGQGASRIERLVVGISGSQTGGQGVLDISLPELVQSGGSFGNWPLNLPPAGSQTTATLNVPYRFMGVTEELSWLAQFAGQGQLRGPLIRRRVSAHRADRGTPAVVTGESRASAMPADV